jgi:hypothetical protein
MAASALSRSRSAAYDAPIDSQTALDDGDTATVSTVAEAQLSFSSAQRNAPSPSWSIFTKFFSDIRAWLPDLRYSYRKDPVGLAAVIRRVGQTETQTENAERLASPSRRRSLLSRMVCASPSHMCASHMCASPPHHGVLPGAEHKVYIVQAAACKHHRAPKPEPGAAVDRIARPGGQGPRG